MLVGPDLTSLATYQATALSEVQLVSITPTEIATSPELLRLFLLKLDNVCAQTEALLAISGQRRVRARFYQLCASTTRGGLSINEVRIIENNRLFCLHTQLLWMSQEYTPSGGSPVLSWFLPN
jgi:hypothetical protein